MPVALMPLRLWRERAPMESVPEPIPSRRRHERPLKRPGSSSARASLCPLHSLRPKSRLRSGMRLRICTWNVNSVRLRAEHAARFVAEQAPDVLCLQEIKCREGEFPRETFLAMGLPHLKIAGQKGWHRAVADRLAPAAGRMRPRSTSVAKATPVAWAQLWPASRSTTPLYPGGWRYSRPGRPIPNSITSSISTKN